MRLALPLALAACALLAPAAHAGTPFTVGEGKAPHVAIGPADTAHVVWNDETDKVFHCRLPRGATACDPLSTIDIGTSESKPFVLVAPDGAILVAMPHYVDEKTYLWRSTDDGRTWGPRATIYGWGGGTDPAEPVLGPQPGQITFAAWNAPATVWSAALDGSEATETAHATLSGTGDFDFAVAPTGDGGLVAVGNDQQGMGFHRLAPGGDPSNQGAWSGATPLGIGDTSRVAGGPQGAHVLSTVGPTDAHMDLRRWNGSSFAAPVEVDDFGFINDVVVGPSGTVGAIWRVNDPNGNKLRHARSTDGGATYATSTIAVEDSIMASMDVALAPDGAGVVVYEGAGGSSGARSIIRVADTTPVEAVSPNPPSVVSKGGAVPGAKLRLEVPGNCVELDSSFLARLTAHPNRNRNSPFRKLARVDFFLGAVRLKKDRKKPFSVTISTDDLTAKKKYTVRVVAKVKLKSGRTVTKSISVTVQAC